MNKSNKNKKTKKNATDAAINVVKTENFYDGIIADPNGSYTGVPIDKNEYPVQDADDL